MKTTATLALLFWAAFSFCQQNAGIPPEVRFIPKGTGQTTGHIADLSITNTSGKPLVFKIPALYIPATGKYQPYVVPYIPQISIGPNETIKVPIEGYCTDIHTPPVPAGESMVPFEHWVIPDPKIPASNYFVPSEPAWTPSGGSTAYIPTVPGTDTPWPYTIDPNLSPGTTAGILLPVIEQISRKFDELKGQGLVSTPFSGNPEKERESVIQQTFWLYSAALTGKGYSKEDFTQQTVKQYETFSGLPITAAPADTKEKMQGGIDQFWGTFEAVGVEAKVLKKPGTEPGNPSGSVSSMTTPGDPPVLIGNDEKLEKGDCECGDIEFVLSLTHYVLQPADPTKPGQRNYQIAQPKTQAVKEDSQGGRERAKAPVDLKGGLKNLKKGDEVLVKLEKVNPKCPCTNGTECLVYINETPDSRNDDKLRTDAIKKSNELAELDEERDLLKKQLAEAKANKETAAKIRTLERKLDRAIEKSQKAAKEHGESARQIREKGFDLPNIRVKAGNRWVDAGGSWGRMTDYAFPAENNPGYGFLRGDNALEIRFKLDFYCEGYQCGGVSCSREFVVKVEE